MESQDADAGSAVEDHDENSLSLVAEKIGTKRLRKTKEQEAAERADQLAVLQKTDASSIMQLDGQERNLPRAQSHSKNSLKRDTPSLKYGENTPE